MIAKMRDVKLLSWLAKKEQLTYYIAYTLIFSFISVVIFSWFYLNDRSIIWQHDGVEQHFVSLVYFGSYLRRIIHDLFATGSLVIPMFDFSIGYGSDILTTLHHNAIGDPLNLLSVFVPASKTEMLYSFLAILRIYLSGIAFSLYCKHMKKPRFATLCGALIFAFCGFSLFIVVRHPFFINSMIYLPLLLIGVELIFAKKKPYLFVVMVFISAMSNFYFFYMITILMVIYTAIRFFAICHENRVKILFKYLGAFSLYYATGLLMACIIFLPTALLALSSARADADNAVGIVYNFVYYARFASAFITHRAHQYLIHMGYSPVALIAVVLLFTKKRDNSQLKTGFLLLTLFLLVPVAGYIFNGFTYVTNRWVWGYSFLVAFITVVLMQDILKPSKRQIIIVTTFMVLYFLQGQLLDFRSVEFFAVCIISFMLIALMYKNHAAGSRFFLPKTAIISFIMLGISIQAYFLYAPAQGNYVEQFYAPGEALTVMTDNSSYAIKQLGDDSFFRYETNSSGGQILNNNTSVLNRQNSLDGYFSLGNPYIIRFLLDDIQFNDHPYEHMYRGLEGRAMPGALASAKYFVVRPGLERFIPYGYNDKVFSTDKYHVFQNNYFLPIGYTYDNIISETTYRGLSAIEKQQVLLQAAVINNTDGTLLNEIEPVFNHAVVPYEMILNGDISYENGVFTVNDTSASVMLLFEGLRDSETYLSINNLHFSPSQPRDNLSADDRAEQSFVERIRFIINNLMEQAIALTEVTVRSGDITRSIYSSTPHFEFYFGRHDYLIHLCYDINGKTEIEITFSGTGIYSFDSLEVINQPMYDFNTQIDRLREVVMENVRIDTNLVTGTINNDRDKFLAFSVPYSKGWRAYLNGEEVDLLNVNTMYSGIYVPAGTHEITLKYITPYLIHGIILTVSGIFIFTGIIVYYERKDKRKEVQN